MPVHANIHQGLSNYLHICSVCMRTFTAWTSIPSYGSIHILIPGWCSSRKRLCLPLKSSATPPPPLAMQGPLDLNRCWAPAVAVSPPGIQDPWFQLVSAPDKRKNEIIDVYWCLLWRCTSEMGGLVKNYACSGQMTWEKFEPLKKEKLMTCPGFRGSIAIKFSNIVCANKWWHGT